MRKILAFGSNAVGMFVDDEDEVLGASSGEAFCFLDAGELKILGMSSSNGPFVDDEGSQFIDDQNAPLGYLESRGIKILVHDSTT